MKRSAFSLLLCGTGLFVASSPPPDVRPAALGALAVTGGTLLDVRTGQTMEDSVLLMSGDRIMQVGRAREVRVPESTEVIDARGGWIIPGLMDLHAHAVGRSDLPVGSGDLPLGLYLANGVTTIRDPAGDVTMQRLGRDAIESGRRIGPRSFFAGGLLDGLPPVWPQSSLIVDTPERAESAVRFLADQGVDCIKVYNHVAEPVLAAIIRTARERGLPVTGHVPRTMTMTRAVEMGLDRLEHIRITGRELLSPEEAEKIDPLPLGRRETLLWERFDLESEKVKRLVAFLAERKVFLDPTLTVDEDLFADLAPHQAKDPNNRHLPRELFESWAKRPRPELFRVPSELKEVAAAGFKKRLQFVGMASRAGVQIVAGTDGPGLGTLLPGFGLQHELELLVQAGLTPLQALQAGTITAARALAREQDLGSLEPGKFADLLILEADPRPDIRNTRKIRLVIKGGRPYEPAALLGAQGS